MTWTDRQELNRYFLNLDDNVYSQFFNIYNGQRRSRITIVIDYMVLYDLDWLPRVGTSSLRYI
jgi:hypothetical protein